MDCLDRTNVVQSMIAAENLNRILREIGILAAHEIIDTYTDFYNLFRFVWADHANIIGKNSGRLLFWIKKLLFFFFHVALQYASSQALKTDLTRTGKRTFTGMLRGN